MQYGLDRFIKDSGYGFAYLVGIWGSVIFGSMALWSFLYRFEQGLCIIIAASLGSKISLILLVLILHYYIIWLFKMSCKLLHILLYSIINGINP